MNRARRDDVVHAHASRSDSEIGQVRREQEVVDFLLIVPSDDFRQDGKRRVVNHHAPVRVVERLVVAARPERAHDLSALQRVFLYRPRLDRLVHVLRRVAVVRRLLRLELFEEAVVVH